MISFIRPVFAAFALVAIVGLSAGAPLPPGKPPAKPPAKAALPGELDEMVRVCHLLEDQRDTLVDLAAQRAKTLADWDAANGPKLAAARKALADAQDARKSEAASAARVEIEALEKDRANAAIKIDHEMMAVLTTQQRTNWDSHKLFQQLSEKFQAAGLSEEQTAKVRKVASDVASLPVPAFADAEAAAKVKKERFDKAYNQVFEKVLTQEQRDALLGTAEPKKEEKPAEKPGPKRPSPRKVR